jgi:3-hydroxyisobutyrate dehydrogenase
MADTAKTVAVLGAGTMGAAIARNAAKAGLAARAWDRTREKAEPLTADGVEVAGMAAEAVDGVDLVVTMLTDGDAVAAVMEQALPSMRDDAVWAQMSTVGIAGTERLSAMADERGVVFVDSPVLGTKQPAEEGKLIVFASGPDDALDRCAPFFDAVAARVMRFGEAGYGTRLKLVTNNWLVGLVEVLAETIAFARGIGVDPVHFLDAIDGGPLGPVYARLKGEMMINEEFEPSFTLANARKDARLVLEAVERHGLVLPLVDVVVEQFDRAVELAHGDEDVAAVYYASLQGAKR